MNEEQNLNKSTKKAWNIADVIGSSYEQKRLAEALMNEFGECIIDEGDEENPYDWWLTDVTVTDIIDFLKNYR